MPNHIISEVRFENVTKEQADEIKKAVLDIDGKVDFNLLIPQPLNIWRGNCNDEHKKMFGDTWYDWNIKNWGTKWNAYESSVRFDDFYLVIVMQTAWSPPMPWFAALFNKFDLDFKVLWMDEGDDKAHIDKFYHGGFDNGKEWSREDASKEDYEKIHILMWGRTREEMDKEDAEYEHDN